jgi:uncharacterized cupin superfamily protein
MGPNCDSMAVSKSFHSPSGQLFKQTITYLYEFEQNKVTKSFLESLVMIEIDTNCKNMNILKLLRDPITLTTPLLVKDSHELSMDDVASNAYLPSSNLSTVSQKLFSCISGQNFKLNDSDFPNFSDAIEYSIKTPGCWCYEKLKDKSTEFNPDKPDPLETYIRVTLGQNNGESPGIPYVMEIWPPKHYSPIHNHANAEAIIRVLHGEINVSLFPFLGSDKPFGTVGFEKDEITWISPNLNQTHQLHNLNSDTTCITIQCYMYDGEDISHYDYFDYIDNNGVVQQYEPDLDMDFIEFKELMKKEWEGRTKSKLLCCFSSN